jgi:hypothetical protein
MMPRRGRGTASLHNFNSLSQIFSADRVGGAGPPDLERHKEELIRQVVPGAPRREASGRDATSCLRSNAVATGFFLIAAS